ncbi:MAG TPA: hypothetical protein VER04_17570 [Polyangiaceae bacterium]|nr:hypothetical protein [Polyangiaceae bacterium]
MKNSTLLSWLLLSGFLPLTRSAAAELVWVQQPGTAKEIAVGSNDMPWIVDSNGVVQYGTPEIACGGGLCVQTDNVQWHVLNADIVEHIGVGLDNVAFITDNVGQIALPVAAVSDEFNGAPGSNGGPLNGYNWFNYFEAARAGQPRGWYYKPTTVGSRSGPRACIGRIAVSANHDSYSSYYGVGCDHNLYSATPQWTWRNGVIQSGYPVWNLQAGTSGAKQVSLFSQVGSVLEQTIWVLLGDAHLHALTNSGYITIEVPRWSNGKAVPGGVTYATDGYAIAGNFVWEWKQGIYGGTGDSSRDWNMLIGTTPNAPLAQIAHAGRLPGPNYFGGGTVGPSRLWALDTAGNIYVAVDRSGPH